MKYVPEKQLYQYDQGVYIIVPDEYRNCTAQFYSKSFPDGLAMENEIVNGKIMCQIPNQMLVNAEAIIVYAFRTGTNIMITESLSKFSVTARPKPPDFVLDPTDTVTYKTASDLITDMQTAKSEESKRVAAESLRASAETERASSETVRKATETERANAESDRASAESSRITAETARANAETSRVTAEQGRINAESERVTAEQNRANAEQSRATAETNRANAESERASAEQERATAENERAKFYDGFNERIGSLKSDLSKWIRLDGVTIKDGTDLSPLIIESGEHGYYSNNGVITPITYNDFSYFKLPIIGGNTYYLDNEFRWAFTTDADGNVVDSDNVGSDRIITSDNAVMLCVTYNKVNLPEYRKIAKGSSPTDTIFEIPSNVVLVNADTDTDNISNGIVSKTGTFSASGDNILLSNARSNLRKGIRLVFEATVTSGTDFEIGFSVSESSANTRPHNIISVTSENISYNNVNYPHGLSITGRLQMLFEYLSDGTVDVTLLSNGDSFKQNVAFTMSEPAVPYVKSNGLIATDCKLSFICTDIRKKIWCFGDSYFAYSTARWTYYLKEYGYDTNVLLDGFPGMGSVNAKNSFKKLLTLGKPSYAVWFMGMNDGTDTDDTTPNANWVTEKDNFIKLCEANGVEPVFATIPNVPSINHKGKNKWIRESGYRYVDMCYAVGADANVNWYGDMLSSDKVHPSESGAKALFAQVLLDLPEVMLDNL